MIVSCPSCQRNYVVADDQIAGKQFRARCKSCGIEFRLDGMSPKEASSTANNDEPAKFMSATEAFLALQTAPPPSAGSWSVCLSKTDTRRMTTDEVAQAYSKGTVGTGMFVWKSGMPKWVRLSEVPELMAAIGKPVSKVPSAAGTSDASASAKPESNARVGSSMVPARGSKPARPLRAATLMGTGAVPPPLSASPTVPPRSGRTFPPRPLEVPDPPSMAPPPIPVSAAPSAAARSDGEAGEAKSEGAAHALGPSVSASGGPASAAGADAGAARRSAPVPPTRGLDIPVDVELPPTGGIVLPPLKGDEAQAAAAGSIAAASSLVPSPTKPEPVANFEPNAAAESAPNAASKAESREASRTSAAAFEDRRATPSPARGSYPPPVKPRGNRFAGVIVAMGVVGVVGVLGGVAGAVYVMKAAGVIGPPAVSVVALQPQPATPASVAALVVPAASAAVPVAQAQGATAVSGGETKSEGMAHSADKSHSNSDSSRAASQSGAARVAATPTPKSGGKTSGSKSSAEFAAPVGFSAPPAATPPAAAPAAASEGGSVTPFNRERALAVLGFAASRAPTCKKREGPNGTARVHVTFEPSGAVVMVNVVGAPIAGTPVGQCVSGIFRKVKIAPFAGDRVTVSRDVTIPP